MTVLNLSFEKSPANKPPLTVGQYVTTNYMANPNGVYKVTSIRYIGSTSRSGYKVRVEPVSSVGPIHNELCACWFFPYVPQTQPEPTKQTAPSNTTSADTSTKVSTKQVTGGLVNVNLPASLLRLNEQREEAKRKFRRLRTVEASQELLAIEHKVATALSKLIAAN